MASLPQSHAKLCRYMTPLDISSAFGYINPVINEDNADLRDFTALKLP